VGRWTGLAVSCIGWALCALVLEPSGVFIDVLHDGAVSGCSAGWGVGHGVQYLGFLLYCRIALTDERRPMGRFLKVILFTFLLVLVLSALLADLPFAQTLHRYLDFALYVRLASLMGLFIALVWLWERKKKTDASQKVQRAKDMLAETEETVRRRKQAIEQLEQKLNSEYIEKGKGLDAQIAQIRSGYDQRIKALKEQNFELKDTVGKLMAALKEERRKRE
jgi:uncharacterized protein YdcH (DUF465 family)